MSLIPETLISDARKFYAALDTDNTKTWWDENRGTYDKVLKPASYLIENDIFLFPWSSQARGFFLEKDLFPKAEHFANPTLEEEKRVWHSKANLLRRDKCFELAEELGCLPIELALAYVLNKHPNIFPLVGPRSIYESESCMQASKINLSEDQLDWLIS